MEQLRSGKAEWPDQSLLNLPEKVLQFGTGVLLRGLPDYFIDKANKQGIFNGRIVVVKSTDRGGTDAFDVQNGLYSLLERGYEAGVKTEKVIVNAAIS
ncbi:MAG TPA: altronate oxidoreductase, partial [Chitinophagaceae bacterium]|nr:altronate oxidoreductase [Chitinophagaceae bacterium]